MDRQALLDIIDKNASDDELYALYVTLMESKGSNPVSSKEVYHRLRKL